MKKAIQGEGIDLCCSLPESLRFMVSSLTPIVNITLLITDCKKGILLTWRDALFYGNGWHISFGCVQMKENLDKRIQIAVLNELGMKEDYQ